LIFGWGNYVTKSYSFISEENYVELAASELVCCQVAGHKHQRKLKHFGIIGEEMISSCLLVEVKSLYN
jgi:hypothetical protein